jgi:hypothetical protein
MRKEDVRKILPGVLAGNGEDAKLIEWCKGSTWGSSK